MNYFELFEFSEAPLVNKSDLSRRYFELQKKFHPDYFTDATEAEKEEVLEMSSAVNKAFVIFKNEQKTVEYFLQLRGMAEDEKYKLSPDFLMEMMEINEMLDEGNRHLVKEKIDEMGSKMESEIRPVLQSFSSETAASDLEIIKDYYYKKKYLNRILDRLVD
ncbi:MAG: Fe-S protein assembly co-chaperone HscB [Bacteroidota bacterium]